MSLDCLCCTLECCNEDSSEIRHSVVSLNWVRKELERIALKEDIDRLYMIGLVERMKVQVERINKAMTHCGRRVYVKVG